MIYRKVVCPHCGNEFTVKSVPEGQKCQWCRRLVVAKFTKGKGRKWNCEVEPMDFPEDSSGGYRGKRSMSSWEDEDIYGHK